MTTDQFIQFLDSKPTHSAKQIKECLKNLDLSPAISENLPQEELRAHFPFFVPYIRKYDVLKLKTFGSIHYILVHKVKGDLIFGVPLTSKENCHVTMQIKEDRRFLGNYLTYTYMCFPLHECLPHYVSVYESKKEANQAFQKAREILKNIL